MRYANKYFIAFIAATLLVAGFAAANPEPEPSQIAPVNLVYPDYIADYLTEPDEPAGSELTELGRSIRGVYIPLPKATSWKIKRLVRWVKDIEANAVILDLKDDRGRVTFSNKLDYAKGSPHGALKKKMAKLVIALQQANIYVIGRIVCFKDNQLARRNGASAIRDKRTGKIWKDKGELAWVDPHSHFVHQYIVNIARHGQLLGFDELQLDYVRFPVEKNARYARYPNKNGTPKRYEVIASLLSKVDKAIDLPLSIDVFGLTAYSPGDKDGLGQSLEHLAPYIDAISPMVYLANWPKKYWENPKPSKTHALVNGAVAKIRERLGDNVAVRPLLQAFKWRADNFGAAFIKNQIDAAQTGGSSGHLFWNQNGNYHQVSVVWNRLYKEDD